MLLIFWIFWLSNPSSTQKFITWLTLLAKSDMQLEPIFVHGSYLLSWMYLASNSRCPISISWRRCSSALWFFICFTLRSKASRIFWASASRFWIWSVRFLSSMFLCFRLSNRFLFSSISYPSESKLPGFPMKTLPKFLDPVSSNYFVLALSHTSIDTLRPT